MNARHRKPTLATAIRATGVIAVAFQLAGLTLVIIGDWNAVEGDITNLGVFCMTLSALTIAVHVTYRRTKHTEADLTAEADLTDVMHTSELPTVPGLTISRNPDVTTVKVTPKKRSHKRVESKK
jgi:hypothetical protein